MSDLKTIMREYADRRVKEERETFERIVLSAATYGRGCNRMQQDIITQLRVHALTTDASIAEARASKEESES